MTKLILSIDAEEDQWDDFRFRDHTVSNIERIPLLQELFDEYGIRPTYLTTFPVASAEASRNVFKKIYEDGKCEIGAHLHPWNTPPFVEEVNASNSMLCNLPVELQREKVRALKEAIVEQFGVTPVSFRAGRWGYSEQVAEIAAESGFLVDSSISPYTDWSRDYGPDFSHVPLAPYWSSVGEVFNSESAKVKPLLEVPVSIAFLQPCWRTSSFFYRLFAQSLLRRLHLNGLLYKAGLLNKIWLSPEVQSAEEMIALSKLLIKKGFLFLNMTFHSNSFSPGLTPFVRTKEDEEVFFQKLRVYFEFLRKEGIGSITLSDAPAEIAAGE